MGLHRVGAGLSSPTGEGAEIEKRVRLGCGQVSMAITTQWVGRLVAQGEGKDNSVVRDVSGTGEGAWRGAGGGVVAGGARLLREGAVYPRKGFPEREWKRMEIERGGPREIRKGMRIWQSEECFSKTLSPIPLEVPLRT